MQPLSDNQYDVCHPHVLLRVPSILSHDVLSPKSCLPPSFCKCSVVQCQLLLFIMREYSAHEACCTCATLLSSIPPTYDEKTEKPSQFERRLDCCDRAICARCLTDNPRFAGYCPFCQISTGPSPLPAQGLRDPPTYSPHADEKAEEELPPYTAHNALRPPLEKATSREHAPDVLHFVDQNNDSIASLSLAYGVPPDVLRRTNKMFADNLLAARRTILVPGEYYKGGVSLSPRPLEGEEEEIKKTKLRKFMVGCKVSEYVLCCIPCMGE